MLPTKASVATSDRLLITTKPKVGPVIDLASSLAQVIDALLKILRQILEQRRWKLTQMVIERVRQCFLFNCLLLLILYSWLLI